MTTTSVQAEWLRRVVAEHASATVTAELQHWLLLIGASAAALDACHRIVDDELVHARLSLDVHRAAGGTDDAPWPPPPVHLPHDPDAPLVLRALAVAADVFCCHEGTAVALFGTLRKEATAPVARAALTRILRDEVRHRAFGWLLLDELLARTGDDGRAFLAPRVPGYLAAVRAAYTAPPRRLKDVERAWGLQSPAAYGKAVESALHKDLEPGFRQRGLFGPVERAVTGRASPRVAKRPASR